MKSQLKAIQQYKKDGSNRYQQVKGMQIHVYYANQKAEQDAYMNVMEKKEESERKRKEEKRKKKKVPNRIRNHYNLHDTKWIPELDGYGGYGALLKRKRKDKMRKIREKMAKKEAERKRKEEKREDKRRQIKEWKMRKKRKKQKPPDRKELRRWK